MRTRAQHSVSRASLLAVRPGLPFTRLREQKGISRFGRAVGTLAIGVVLYAGYAIVAKRHAAVAVPQEYATANADSRIIRLGDGTDVVLNVASRLRLAPGFGTTSRDVFLTGEAQFTVKHDPARPFVVHAGGIVVRDLATLFAVRAYPGDGRARIVVAQGKVAISAPAAPRPNGAEVSAGSVATITDNGETVVEATVASDDLLGWTQGRLTFRHTPMRDALMQLSRWYDVQFDVSDSSLLHGTLTTTVRAAPLDTQTLNDLAYLFDARITRHGRLITIAPASRR